MWSYIKKFGSWLYDKGKDFVDYVKDMSWYNDPVNVSVSSGTVADVAGDATANNPAGNQDMSDLIGNAGPTAYSVAGPVSKAGTFFTGENMLNGLVNLIGTGYSIYQDQRDRNRDDERYEDYKKYLEEQREREDTAYQRAAADMRSAGLSPLSGVNPSEASGASPSSASAGSSIPGFGELSQVLFGQRQLEEQTRHNREMETVLATLGSRNASVSEENAKTAKGNLEVSEGRLKLDEKKISQEIKNLVQQEIASKRGNDYYTDGAGRGANESSSDDFKKSTELINSIQNMVDTISTNQDALENLAYKLWKQEEKQNNPVSGSRFIWNMYNKKIKERYYDRAKKLLKQEYISEYQRGGR